MGCFAVCHKKRSAIYSVWEMREKGHDGRFALADGRD